MQRRSSVIENTIRSTRSFRLNKPFSRDFAEFDEYFDALSTLSPNLNRISRTNSVALYGNNKISAHDEKTALLDHNDINSFKRYMSNLSTRPRRSEIKPRPSYSNIKAMLTSLKNSIGKDLSTVALPVCFSEPMSVTQRATEYLAYSHLLDKASECDDSLEQMTYVAAFYISVYGSYFERIAKPFNPLLNETFEFDRMADYGWRSICEQITHHPPRIAFVNKIIYIKTFTSNTLIPSRILLKIFYGKSKIF